MTQGGTRLGTRRPKPALLRYGTALAILMAAFGAGICLGKLPLGRGREEPLALLREGTAGTAVEGCPSARPAEQRAALPAPDIRRAAKAPPQAPPSPEVLNPESRAPEPWDVVRGPGDGFRLRMRTVSRLSSGHSEKGSRVTFLTEHAIQDAAGGIVPAGSLVEGFITQASSATKAEAGRLVIQIHSIRAGARLFTLDALPFATDAGDGQEAQGAGEGGEQQAKAITRPGQHQQPGSLHAAPDWLPDPAPEAAPPPILPLEKVPVETPATEWSREVVLPKEAVLEFELLQRPTGSGDSPAEAAPVRPPEHKPKPAAPFSKPGAKTPRSAAA